MFQCDDVLRNSAKRSLNSVILLTKLTVAFTVINCVVVLVEYIDVDFKRIPADRQTYHLELSKRPKERLSSFIIRGAETKYVTLGQTIQGGKSDVDPDFDPKDFRDVFLSVRTTNKFHKTRLIILLDTWMQFVPTSVWIFTDKNDTWLSEYILKSYHNDRPNVIETLCPTSTEEKYALACKMYWEYQSFLSSRRSWFCHFDDDAYVNVRMLLRVLKQFSKHQSVYLGKSPSRKPVTAMVYESAKIEPEVLGKNETSDEPIWFMRQRLQRRVSFHYALGGAGFCISRKLAIAMKPHATAPQFIRTVASIALPDDCVVGFIITHILNVSLISADFFHAHLEDLQAIQEPDLLSQISISYRIPGDYLSGNFENTAFFNGNSSVPTTYLSLRTRNNIINIKGEYSPESDPTRFYSYHERLERIIKRNSSFSPNARTLHKSVAMTGKNRQHFDLKDN